MAILLIVKIIGFIMMVIPVTAFLVVAWYAIVGSAEDDPMVKGMLYLGAAIFLIGAGILLLAYLTDFFPSLMHLPTSSKR